MERHGWRAIIYDAPWAYFKKDQIGVIVSEDGKSCETFDDDKSSVIIMADAYLGFDDRQNGHVLFRQKGSDLFDIVCLKQEPGGIYELMVEDVNVNGCQDIPPSEKYIDFIESLKITEIINGERHILTTKEKLNMNPPIQPEVDEFSDFVNDGDTVIEYKDAIEVTKRGVTKNANIYVLPSGEEIETCGDILFNIDESKIKIEKVGVICDVKIEPHNVIGNGGDIVFSSDSKCIAGEIKPHNESGTGGIVVFSANTKYGIYFDDGVSASIHCVTKKCSTQIRERDINVTDIKYYRDNKELIKENDYYVIEISDDEEDNPIAITIEAKYGVETKSTNIILEL